MEKIIIDKARTWIGTSFKHQGRIKINQNWQGACDCLGLIMGVADEIKAISKFDNKLLKAHDLVNYDKYPSPNVVYNFLNKHLTQIEDIKFGAIVVIKISNNLGHLGIIGDHEQGLSLIHAYAPLRKIIEHRLDEYWQSKIFAYFSF